MSFNSFVKSAQETTSLSAIMVGRQKLETEEILGKELTIIGFDFAPKFDKEGKTIVDESTGEVDTFGVVVFKEMEDKYYCVGTVFTKVCHVWLADFDGDLEKANDELKKAGGVRVRFTASKTKKGNNLTSVEVIG